MSPPSSIFDVLARQAEILRRLDRLERFEPVRIVAKYRTNAGQSFNSGSTDIINFEDQIYDSHSAVTTGASWKFTAPAAGHYRVTAALLWNTTTAWAEDEYGAIELFKDGTAVSFLDRVVGLDSSGATALKFNHGYDELYMAIGSYIDVRAVQNTGSALTLFSANSLYNYVTISRIG